MIKVQNLAKTFGAKRAVDGVSFSVDRGEVLGFLGPNGAGKSTTMRMVTGFLPPSGGTASIGGFDIVEHPIQAKRLMGYLPENAPAYTDMTVYGFLNFAAEIRGLSGDAKKQAVTRVVEMCFLEPVLHQSVETLSKGYRHRTCFAQSIIHDPDVLVLDEPTDGLDPNQKHEIRQLIRRMGQKKAIIFSTHILEEVDAVCSRAIIIDRGRIVANGTPQELRQKSEWAGAVTLRVKGVASSAVTASAWRLSLPRSTPSASRGSRAVGSSVADWRYCWSASSCRPIASSVHPRLSIQSPRVGSLATAARSSRSASLSLPWRSISRARFACCSPLFDSAMVQPGGW